MKTLMEIGKMIALPEEVKEKICGLEFLCSTKGMEEILQNLTEKEHWEKARERIRTVISPDEDGWKMLFFMLYASRWSYEKYRQRGISDKIFADTMGCFTRFVGEYQKIYGKYGFDRDFWVGRQLSLELFRLGELEYEKVVENGEKAISVHIPSDAVLSEENCRKSIKLAQEFFKEQDEKYADVKYYCSSWLLSPALKKLLPDTSRIIKFQNLFTIQSVDENAEDYMYWIFKMNGNNLDTLPENTTLQRRAKQYLLSGGKIGIGKGYLKKQGEKEDGRTDTE